MIRFSPSKPSPQNICRNSFRAFSSSRPTYFTSTTSASSPAADTFPPKSHAATLAYTKLPHRSVLHISGPDAIPFLQGLITQNVSAKLASTSNGEAGDGPLPFYAGFLNAQGRVLVDAIIYPTFVGHKDGRTFDAGDIKAGDFMFFVEVDKESAVGLQKHLRRHKLRSKIELGIGELSVWASWYNDSRTAISPSTFQLGFPDPRLDGFGYRFLTPESVTIEEIQETLETDLEPSPVEEYTLRRMMYGIAEGPKEIITDSALPLESNLDFLNGIDYRKGCYIGQELTIRTHHRGVVRKRILPVQLCAGKLEDVGETLGKVAESQSPVYDSGYPDSSHLWGTDIVPAVQAAGGPKRPRPVGKLLTSVGNVGLALCRLEAMTDLVVGGSGEEVVEGKGPGMFKLAVDGAGDGEVVGVKAFVPPWLRTALESKN